MSSPALLAQSAAFLLQGAISRLPPAALFVCLVFIPAGLAFALVSHIANQQQQETPDLDDYFDDGDERDAEEAGSHGGVESAARAYLRALEASMPRPLEEVVLDMIPLLKYQGQSGEPCVVCLCPFEEEEMVRVLPPCNHCFHVPCIDAWFETHSTCPLCRSKVSLPGTTLAAGAQLLKGDP